MLKSLMIGRIQLMWNLNMFAQAISEHILYAGIRVLMHLRVSIDGECKKKSRYLQVDSDTQ